MSQSITRGQFIVIEGGEGVGKSTNSAFIREYLSQKGIDFIHTREPGGTPLAEEIRELLISTRDESVSPMAELLLIFAARAQHLEQVILPALERGQWVISDRFIDATYVYQGAARGLGDDAISTLEQLVLSEFKADQVIVLDADLSVSQARARNRGALDRFEQEPSTFHQCVRDAYLSRAENDPSRYLVVDASQSLDVVQASLIKLLDGYIASYRLSVPQSNNTSGSS
ncbi:MAG: dTMP kinase [Pseudomonadota bacterium]